MRSNPRVRPREKPGGPSIANIVFDVDGTLLDSKIDIAGAQIWALRQLGVTDIQPEDLYPNIGRPLTETFRKILPPSLHTRIPEAAILYRDYYRPRALDNTRLFGGVRETLDELRRRNYRLAVATIKSSPTTARVLGHFAIASLFDTIQGTDDMPAKPDPFILNKILMEQDWKAEETLMVGDSEVDVLMGRNADTRTCAVTYGALTAEQAASVKPDWVIERFPELLDILARPA